MSPSLFSKNTISFLERLAENNNRPWFNENKELYEEQVRTPALNFIEDMQPFIARLSPHFTAVSKKTGGSLMRPYRDIRFGKNKTPYKTNIGIQFRHVAGKDVHAPGFYLHISPESCFVGAGIWRPDGKALAKIREMISDNPNAWKKLSSNKKFIKYFSFSGESLKTYPRGYPKDHPLINDLKRKDFIAIHHIRPDELLRTDLTEVIHQHFKVASPLVDYLCSALDLSY